MAWQDRLAAWVDGQVQRSPALDHWLEARFHAMGLHGPALRHLLKTRFIPAATTFVVAFLLLVIGGMILRRAVRSRGRRRRPAPARAS